MTTINSDDNTQNVVQITAKKPSVKQKLIAMNGSQEGLPVFKNWHSIVTADNQEIKIALSQNALCDQFLKLMPECITVNDTLHIVRGSVIKPLPSAKKLSVAIRKKDILLDFQPKLSFGLPMDEFHEAVTQEAPQYTLATHYPRWPRLPDHFVIKDLPPERNGKLDELVSKFCVSRPVDRDFLKALFISPAWSNGWGCRPLFVIGGENKEFDDDHGTGKSTIMMLLEKIYGKAATIPDGLSRDRLIATFQSIKNQNRLLVKMDNIRNTFENTALEGYITDEWIGGYKLGEGASEIRNEFTFILTANSPHLNKDGAYRAVLIKLKRPSVINPEWKIDIERWIHDNFELLLADIGSYLVAPKVPGVKISQGVARWANWIATILNKVNPEAHKAMADGQDELQTSDDHEILHDRLVSFVTHYYRAKDSTVNLDAEADCIFVTNDLMFDIYKEAFSINIKKTPYVFVTINKLLTKLGFLRTRMGVRIDGLGQVKGYAINYDKNAPTRLVYILAKHHRHGANGVYHQPSCDFKDYLV